MYDWDFGDGTRTSSSYPETAHTYSVPGTFTVTLTVANTSGTSTKQVFTGQTVSNNGGPSAERSESVIVGPPASPETFVGKVRKNKHERKQYLKTTWKKNTAPGVAKYQIFSRNKKIKTISAKHSPKEYIRLHHYHHVSGDYRKHLSKRYRIRAVGSNRAASTFTQLRVIE
jgi:PKD repeat protein